MITDVERRELERRERLYRTGRRPTPADQVVILVDDDLAMGSTMRAAVRAGSSASSSQHVMAVPAGAAETCEELRNEVDDLVCIIVPEGFGAVGAWFCVPKMLDVLREYVLQQVPEAGGALEAEPRSLSTPRRLWRYRRVHRRLGWKFWSFVVGAAPLERELEEFWSRLGFVVVQGYGLTETAPVVTVNHPFKPGRGTAGEPIPGVNVKIAADGEILVRGENVSPGYFQADKETAAAFEGGWLHTGDIGEIDPSGRLIVRGRKKEMIVTPEGLNVFPEDVERVLNDLQGVRESAVVGVVRDGEERVHAVLALESGASQDDIVRQANATLEEHQKIRSASVWAGDGLPRTEGTRKLKRRELKRWAETGTAPATRARPASERPVTAIVAELAHRDDVTANTTLDELGLSSLERIELMTALEERFDTTLDEAEFSSAQTVGDLEALVQRGAPERGDATARAADGAGEAPGRREVRRAPRAEAMTFPAWNRRLWARGVRRASLPIWILPLARVFVWLKARGLKHVQHLGGPVILASNHLSHMDTPAILMALPPRWRYRMAPAMAKDFFDAHFRPERHRWRKVWTLRTAYYLAALFFNAFPIPRREGGTRETLRYMGDIVSDGFSILNLSGRRDLASGRRTALSAGCRHARFPFERAGGTSAVEGARSRAASDVAHGACRPRHGDVRRTTQAAGAGLRRVGEAGGGRRQSVVDASSDRGDE